MVPIEGLRRRPQASTSGSHAREARPVPAAIATLFARVLPISIGQVEAILVEAGLMEAPEKAEPEAGADEEEQPEDGGVFSNTEVG